MSAPADLQAAATLPNRPTVQEPPATIGRALGQIGPGLILAGAIVGTGELIATTNLGARAGFALLWLVIVSCFIKVFVQIELGRYAINSGLGTFASFRRLPGPGLVLVWWCVIMIAFTQMQIGAMIGGIARSIQMALGESGVTSTFLLSENTWAVLVTALTIAMLASGSYRLVEGVSTLLVAGFTFMTILCVAFLPAEHAITASQVASGLTFRIPPGAVVAAFTMFGITGVGASELLAYPYWCIEKGYARHVGPWEESPSWAERARGWMRVLRLDAWVSMAVYTVATLAFYLLGASVLHKATDGQEIPAGELIPTLAAMYKPVLGARLATWFIVFGAVCVLYSTLFAATAGNSRILTDFLRVSRYIDPERDDLRRRSIQVFCATLPALGLGLFLGFGDLVMMVKVGGVMQGISLPFIAGAAVFLRYRRTDRRITPGLLWDAFLWLSLLGLSAAAVYSVWNGFGELSAMLRPLD